MYIYHQYGNGVAPARKSQVRYAHTHTHACVCIFMYHIHIHTHEYNVHIHIPIYICYKFKVAMGLLLPENLKRGNELDKATIMKTMEDEAVILTDILGLEDALGTMDFKV